MQKRKKMTSTVSGKGRSFVEFDNHKNQEWLRRRKLRLEQVRKQSIEIAKTLRERTINDEKTRLNEFDKLSEVKFADWRDERLEELELKLRCALEEFGQSFRLAENEPDPEEIIEMEHKMNIAKAQKRGEIAKQEEFKMRKIAEEKKMSGILRKQLTRKKEDLRSALLRSVPLKKQLIKSQEVVEEKKHSEKLELKRVRKKKVSPHKSCQCKQKTTFKDDKVWINLNDLKSSSTGDSGLEAKSSKSTTTCGKSLSLNERPEGLVEFYDFSSRYYCKSFREFPHLVERIQSKPEMINANELAQLEDEKEKIDERKKLEADAMSQERGVEALRREKIRRDYNKLVSRLEELNKKEKVLKAQQRILPNFFHMNDERLREREKTKQRTMESKFESIYWAAIEQMPQTMTPTVHEFPFYQGGGDFVESNCLPSTKFSFSSTNLKPNTPVTSSSESSKESSSDVVIKRKNKTKKKGQLLVDIDNALRIGRKLRKTISRNSNVSEEENEQNKSNSSIQMERIESLPEKVEEKITKSQESQTEELALMSLKMFDGADDSIPPSSATSYKSPPSAIRSCCLRDFLEYFEDVSQTQDSSQIEYKSKFKRKVDGLLNDLLPFEREEKLNENQVENECESPSLEYYVEKLLNMSRECVANLSVSSDNFSTPNTTEFDRKEFHACEPELYHGEVENSNPKPRLNETITNWKDILERNSEKSLYGSEEIGEEPSPEMSEEEELRKTNISGICHPEIRSKYEEITKKCSERISELSDMLEKLRKDKEKLHGSNSVGSSVSLTKETPVDEELTVRRLLENPVTSLVFQELRVNKGQNKYCNHSC